jgi:two-component system, cell cycle sensor histidine kinase and response regulator CckA
MLMIMPGMGGCELERELCPLRPGMKVLYISGYPEAAGEGAATEVLLFRKPFSGGALLAKVREVLSPAEAQPDLQEKSTC